MLRLLDLSDEAQVPNRKMIKKKAKDNAKHNQLYKYTVFVVDGGNNNKPLKPRPDHRHHPAKADK